MFKQLINLSNSGYITNLNLKGADLDVTLEVLEPIQKDFHEKYLAKIPISYSNKWPVDKLHWWSRPAEYAFILYHLIDLISKSNKNLSILEVGPGCSFIPYALSKFTIISSLHLEDIDPSVINFWKEISSDIGIDIVEHKANDTNNVVYDIIYSVSVVEHVHSPDLMVRKLIDQLANDGTLILTLDIDISNKGDYGLITKQLNSILNIKDIDFTYGLTNRSLSHIADIATPKNGWWINSFKTKDLKNGNYTQFRHILNLVRSFILNKSDARNISVIKLIGKKIKPN